MPGMQPPPSTAAMLATQDLSEALPGVDPAVLQHLSAAWRSTAAVGQGA